MNNQPEELVHPNTDILTLLNQLKQYHEGLLNNLNHFNHVNQLDPNDPDHPDWVDESDYNGEMMGDYLSSEHSEKLDDEELDMINLIHYEDATDRLEEDPACSICFREYKQTQEKPLRDLPCKHIFHQECVDPWLT